MKIYNTYTNKKEEFKPVVPGEVSIYICGPTVYNYIHIGNARPVIFFDVVRRYFEYKGNKVTFVSNFTDIDDKIINRAIEENVSEKEVSEKYIEAFLKDNDDLNIKRSTKTPKVTEYMTKIIDFIQELIDKEYAYSVDGDVYFRVSKIDDYGKLSGMKLDELISGARIEANDKKEHPADFTLWKKTDKGITFDAPFGNGRPGWHTECVAMIKDIFKGKIDIHGGGSDLRFPHHENEVAQSIAISNDTIANYWMHNGRLNINNEKMSKSSGNFITVRELLKETNANAFKLFMLSAHYRSPINYSSDAITDMVKLSDSLTKSLKAAMLQLAVEGIELPNVSIDEFDKAMEDDFNTSNAITEVQKTLKEINKATRSKEFEQVAQETSKIIKMLDILGVKLDVPEFTNEIIATYKEMEEARSVKNFERSDELRKKLIEVGVL